MAPLHRREETSASVEGRNCREAAVLALFFPEEGESQLLLTVRPEGMTQHAGQVALPGGRREPEESLEQTALRETHEEVHIEPDRIELIGRLSPLFVTPSKFCVYPFIGWMESRPDLSVTSDEVAWAFGAPLSDLVHPQTRKTTLRTIRGRELNIPYFDLEGHFVWGATAMMLSELAAALNPVLLDRDPLEQVSAD